MKKFIPVAAPCLGKEELNNLIKAFKSGWISSRGEYIEKFEKEFAKYLGVKYATTVSNGTTALHLAILALGIKKGDEVIIPDLSYVAVANAVSYAGATPVAVGVETDFWCLDPKAVLKAITKKTKAIIPVHLYGNVVAMEEILKIAKKRKLFVVEDAAEAHGAEYKGKKAGSFGNVGIFSFFGNKIITTGEGGMAVTNDKKVYERMAFLKNQAQSPENRYWHPEIGFNYRMTNLQAAIGLAQLKKINSLINKKRRIFRWYKKYLGNTGDFRINGERKGTKSVYWMVSLVLEKIVAKRISRDKLMEKFKKEGVETRPFFYPISELPMYEKCKKVSVSDSRDISGRGLNLPSGFNLTEKDVKFICGKIKDIVSRH